MGIGQELESAIDLLLNAYVSSKSAALCTALVPIALTGGTIYFVLMGFAVMRGEANDTLHTFLWKTFRMAFIAGIALSAGEYQVTILNASDGLVTLFTEALSGFTTVGSLVDDLAKPFSDLGQQIWNKAVVGFWPNFGLVAAAGGVAIAEFFIFAIGLGFFLLAKVSLALVLAIGPAYVLCAMWPGTEKYTESWIGQVLNYTMLKVLVAASITMLLEFASQFAAHIDATQDAVNVVKATTALLCCSGALAVVMLNLPQLASALAGGASLSGIGRTIGRAFLDAMNRPPKPPKPKPEGGRIGKGRGAGAERGQAVVPLPPPRAPLFQSNVIERLRRKS